MGMPQIPEAEHRPSFRETQIDLLESIALEELSIAHILNAQGEKTQAVVKKFRCCELSFRQVLEDFRSTEDMVQSLIMKQWLLLTKLRTVARLHAPDCSGMPPAPEPCDWRNCEREP